MWVGSFTPFAVGPILWIALFVASFVVKRHARPLAHAHLAVAWLCFLGWLLNPYYSVTRQGILHNDMLFWGTLMLLASAIGFWIVAARGRAVDPRLCRACRYDLTGNVSGVCPECGRAVAGGDGSQPASA